MIKTIERVVEQPPFFLNKKELKELLDWTIYESGYYHEVDPNTGYPINQQQDDKTKGYIDVATGAYIPNFAD